MIEGGEEKVCLTLWGRASKKAVAEKELLGIQPCAMHFAVFLHWSRFILSPLHPTCCSGGE